MNKLNKIMTLSSGARLLCVQSDLPISVVSVWFHAGSRFDPIGKEGLAHFFEHLLMTRTDNYPDKTKRLQAISEHGIRFNAFTGQDTAYYFYEQSADKTLQGLNFLLDGLNYSILSAEDVEHEKTIIIDEQTRKYANPANYITSVISSALWPRSPLGRGVLGTKESISNISLPDLIEFKEKFYQPDNAVFVVVSPHQPQEIKEIIEKSYRVTGVKTLLPILESFAPPETQIDYRDINSVTASVNFRTTSQKNTEDIIVLDLLQRYMADTWISQLIKRMRIENNITYWVSGGSNTFSDFGFACYIFSVSPVNLDRGLRLVFEEINKVKTGEISEKDLAGVKAIIRTQFLKVSINPMILAGGYGAQMFGKNILAHEDYVKRIEHLVVGDIQRVAQKYLTKENLALAFIGKTKGPSVTFG